MTGVTFCWRALAWMATSAITTLGIVCEAADTGGLRRIGVLMPPIASQEEGLRQGLRDLGYVEGGNLSIEWRKSSGARQELERLAADLERSGAEVIVASGTPAAYAAARATKTPVVFLAADPVGTGLVESLSKPGRNRTGVSALAPELSAKRLEVLKLMAPRARRIAYFMNSLNPLGPPLLHAAQDASRALGLQLIVVDARTPPEIDKAFESMSTNPPDAILLAADFLFLEHKTKIANGVRLLGIPAISPEKESGLIISYGPDLREAIRRTAPYVDKILNGAKAADLPIEQVSEYKLVVNLRVAKAMGLEVPQSILVRADEVIQ